jgi:hypothetical protein
MSGSKGAEKLKEEEAVMKAKKRVLQRKRGLPKQREGWKGRWRHSQSLRLPQRIAPVARLPGEKILPGSMVL